MSEPQDKNSRDFRSEEFSENEVFEILANRRRRNIIRYFAKNKNQQINVTELVNYIQKFEDAGEESCYISLIQNHLPKLSDSGIIQYNNVEKTVEPDKIETVSWCLEKVSFICTEE